MLMQPLHHCRLSKQSTSWEPRWLSLTLSQDKGIGFMMCILKSKALLIIHRAKTKLAGKYFLKLFFNKIPHISVVQSEDKWVHVWIRTCRASKLCVNIQGILKYQIFLGLPLLVYTVSSPILCLLSLSKGCIWIHSVVFCEYSEIFDVVKSLHSFYEKKLCFHDILLSWYVTSVHFLLCFIHNLIFSGIKRRQREEMTELGFICDIL